MVTGSGLQFLTFNSDLRVFFSKENPQLQALEDLENTYTKSDNIVFVLEPKEGNVFTRETLGAVEKLTDRAWQTTLLHPCGFPGQLPAYLD